MTTAFPVLMYHSVAPLDPAQKRRSMQVSPEQLRAQLQLLKKRGYVGVGISEALARQAAGFAGRLVAITFDDGYRDNLEHALPALQDAGFTATCYFVSGHLGGSNAWDSGKHPARTLMSAADARTWAQAGMEVGSHTVSHRKLTSLASDEAAQELIESRSTLAAATGASVSSFAYPFGDFGPDAEGLVRAAGYGNAVTTVRGKADPAQSPFLIPRIAVNSHHPLALFQARLWWL